jgi:hypothetical protein
MLYVRFAFHFVSGPVFLTSNQLERCISFLFSPAQLRYVISLTSVLLASGLFRTHTYTPRPGPRLREQRAPLALWLSRPS